MELIATLRLLWRRRLALAAGCVLVIGLGVVIGKQPATRSGLAWGYVMLDTPSSQVVAAAPQGADTLPWRAEFLIHLMRSDEAVARVAAAAGIPADELTVMDPALASPTVNASLPAGAAEAAGRGVAPNVLLLYMANDTSPVISVEVSAPDTAGARLLAEAAVRVLTAEATPKGVFKSAVTSGGGLTKLQPYTVEATRAVRSELVTVSPGYTKAAVTVVGLLLLWTAAVVFAPYAVQRLTAYGRLGTG